MAEWPEEVITAVHKYFPDAEKLLNAIPSNMISSNEGKKNAIFGELQEKIYNLVKRAPSEFKRLRTRVDFAPLAVKADMYRYYSVTVIACVYHSCVVNYHNEYVSLQE